MQHIKAPNPVPNKGTSVFLAGTIDMGNSEDWQSKIAKEFKNYEDLVVVNPRRDEWDSSWEQTITNPKFNEQVTWELNNIENADILFFYIKGDSQSPITLMELGIAAEQKPMDTIVVCEPGFWRKGNIEVLCVTYGMRLVEDLELGLIELHQLIDLKESLC